LSCPANLGPGRPERPASFNTETYVSLFLHENERMSRGLLPDPPRSVLLVRLSARGDIVFASPLVRAFRRTYPDVKLTWIAESHTKDLIEGHPELDEIMVVDRNGWKRLWKERRIGALFREIKELARSLRRREFDLAIDLQGLLRSGIVTFLSGAPIRIGLGSKEKSHLLMTQVLSRTAGDRRRISSEYRHLAEQLGLDLGDFRMEVPLAEEDRSWAKDKEEELGLQDGFFVALPFTTTPQKHWREDRWAGVMDRIAEELGLPTVVLGGPEDEEALGRIRAMSSSDPMSLVGKTTLTQASAMVERATLVIGVDTGLSHMAIAFDRPTVTIFGSNIPYTKPPTDRAKVIVNWLECSPCRGNPTCNGAFTCTELITVDQVLETAREVLGNAGPQPRGNAGPQPRGSAGLQPRGNAGPQP
jgi:heptosyltransferase-1